jgi:hypothetical protein
MPKRTKKRKNAGEGYGYMFHGAFKEKKDAVAKERKTKGAWVKGVFTKQGHRYVVMSPRTNPIKRKKRVTPEEASGYLKYDFAREWSNATSERERKRIKRKLEQMKKIALRDNPHELLVLGANPSEVDTHNTQEISLPPGATIVIRTPRQNPENPDRYTSAHAIASGAKYTPPGLIQTKRQKRVAGLVRVTRQRASRHKYDWIPEGGITPGNNPDDSSYMHQAAAELYGKPISQLNARELSQVAQLAARLKQARRQNVELGTFENGVFHPWTRRPKSRQKKAIRRQNPDAVAIREDFTGAPVEYETTLTEPHMPAGDYAQLGELLALYVKPHAGGQVQHINFREPRPLLVSDDTARQLYFVDGDQDVTASLGVFGARDRGAGLFELGEARRIDYKQRKEHVKDPDVDEWRHEFGEETGHRPILLFDSRHKRLLLDGGAYEVRREGIVN